MPLRAETMRSIALAGRAALLLSLVAGNAGAQASDAPAEIGLPPGDEVVRRINARDEGEASSRRVTMELIDKRGGRRVRETHFVRRFFGDEKRTAIFYLSPMTIKGTAFLTWDHPEVGRDDDQWLYLPAVGRVRRISATDRGDYFLGTDLTYEDIKKETKVAAEDYSWKTIGEEVVDAHPCLLLESVPASEEISRELGYSRVVSAVDRGIWIMRKADYWDLAGRHLKTSLVSDIRQVDGIWTPHRIEVRNHRTGHKTVFTVADVDYESGVDEDLLTQRALERGLR